MLDGPGVSMIRVGGRSFPIASFMAVPRSEFWVGLCKGLRLDSAAHGDEKWGQFACLVSLNRAPAVNLQNGSGKGPVGLPAPAWLAPWKVGRHPSASPVSYEKTWCFLAVSGFASCSPAKLKGLYPYARLQNWPQIAMATGKISAAEKPKISRVEVYWHTVRYRTVVLVVDLFVSAVFAAFHFAFPQMAASMISKISDSIAAPSTNESSTAAARQARFVNLVGKVQVKKSNSVEWMNADDQLSLDKGDLIQTGGEGVARIQFAAGTTYTVKGDTLVTVEDNVVQHDRATKVGVHISSGQVDLATGSWEISGSGGEVSFENAVASVRANSRAAVRSDPTTNQQEITVDNGSAELNRGGQHLDIGQWERAAFTTGGPTTQGHMRV